MSSRAIVSLGVWILAMVLVGTLTVGVALAFYVALTALCALVAVALSVLSHRRAVRRERGDPDDEEGMGTEQTRSRPLTAAGRSGRAQEQPQGF
ncbi:hypothetical protein [Azospirillum agricola]|uniref:hypothetical protein n=1 Tax=Azospirillum agricola TaxID=1720247 RepID=UPI000A0EF592|nr:hypothetical protein [Azospirillum agricola]SMH47382.1 hypothetical protein SAMN02982994_2580 [Azospirillum lipoferum]